MDSLRDSFTLDIDQFSQFASQSQQSSTIPALAPRGESGYSYHDTTSHHSQPGTSQHNVVMSYPRMNNVAKASNNPSSSRFQNTDSSTYIAQELPGECRHPAYIKALKHIESLEVENKLMKTLYSQLLTAISPGATSHPQPAIGAAKPLVASKPQSHQMKSLDISVNSVNSPDMPNELDYPHAAYWTREEWDSFRDDQKISGLHTTNSRRIRLKDLSLPNPSLAYITNEVGTGVNGYQAKDMQQTARRLFAPLHEAGYAPKTWTRAPFDAVEYFRANMYKHYPDLRLCEGHWKLNLFASQEYPAFTRPKNGGNVKEEPESDNSSSPIPETPKKRMHTSSDKPARNVKKNKVNHPVPGTAGPSSGSTCAVAIPASTSKGSPIVSLTSSSEMFTPSSDSDFALHTMLPSAANQDTVQASTTKSSAPSTSSTADTPSITQASKSSLCSPALLDTLCSTLPVSIPPSASAPLPLSSPVQPLKSTIKELISASPLTPNGAPDIPGNTVLSSNPSIGDTTAMLKQPEASAQIINPFAQRIHAIPKVNLQLPEPPPPAPSLNNASKCKKNLDDAVWKPSPKWNSANNLFGIDYIRTHLNASKINVRLAFEGLSAQEKKVYADRGAYNKKNKIPPQLDSVDASEGSLDDKQSREMA
ncbi:hypothetical protein JB92DRAFT_3144742 [Gautieria morchelliformis]|nr:hypothetical protein JB92DRAFT_3144742 [Gautieria morchelliformis]